MTFCDNFSNSLLTNVNNSDNHSNANLPSFSSPIGQSEFIENFSFESSLKFLSAYGRPKYTNYTELFAGCLDYIFFNPSQLECKETVPLIPHEEVTANRAIPCVNIPSDHLALVCTLKFV